MPLFGNTEEINSNAIKFPYKEIEDTVVGRIKAELSKYELEDDHYKLIFSHSYHQVLGVLDELFDRNSVASMDFILPEYETREDNTLIIDKPLLNKYRIKKDKESILELIKNICDTTVTSAAKGVSDYVNGKRSW